MNHGYTALPELQRLIDAGEAAEREGQKQRARSLYEQALYALREPGQAPLAGALLRWCARSHLEEGNADAAAEIAAAALRVSELAEDRAGVAHANNVLGNCDFERGDMEGAEALYTLARSQARAAGDNLLVAMAEQNAGIVANIRGDYRLAMKRYRASLAGHRALGRSAYVAHALNNVGMLCTDLRRWRAAERAFGEAMEVCAEVGDTVTLARVAGNRIEPWIAQRRWRQAREACYEALRMAEAAGETSTMGEVQKHLGVIARETGDHAAAARHLAAAERIAEERGDVVLQAETAREQARLHWEGHHHRETLQALNRAHRLFSRLQARRDLADVDEQIRGLESLFLNIVEQWGQSIES
ncbi:MAG TPA: tetratricopeptide repeat protein, partial [Longimicrobium sp.]